MIWQVITVNFPLTAECRTWEAGGRVGDREEKAGEATWEGVGGTEEKAGCSQRGLPGTAARTGGLSWSVVKRPCSKLRTGSQVFNLQVGFEEQTGYSSTYLNFSLEQVAVNPPKKKTKKNSRIKWLFLLPEGVSTIIIFSLFCDSGLLLLTSLKVRQKSGGLGTGVDLYGNRKAGPSEKEERKSLKEGWSLIRVAFHLGC